MFWHFVQIVSSEDNCMKCQDLFSSKKKKKKKENILRCRPLNFPIILLTDSWKARAEIYMKPMTAAVSYWYCYIRAESMDIKTALFSAREQGMTIPHYENTPIQIYWKFYNQKRKLFREKKTLIFSYFCSKHTLWVFVRTASSMFWADIRKKCIPM